MEWDPIWVRYISSKSSSNIDLTLAAGRLAANYTFAGLSVFDNYMSAGINATPHSLLVNDLSDSGPSGLEWGAGGI